VVNKIWVGVVIVLVLTVGYFMFSGSTTGNVVKNGEEISIPLSKISGQASFYEYNNIKYFVIKASDGSIKTAFDACDVCYYSDKGYRQEGNYMVCNNCGNRYPIAGLGTENLRGGGCWPGYLPSVIEGEYLIIKESDLDKGGYRFR
tara:strand:- start:100 stop:537 length:438 start_codon:yes stop_codon:yes gene_type:complete